jgi:hypothetical protein
LLLSLVLLVRLVVNGIIDAKKAPGCRGNPGYILGES